MRSDPAFTGLASMPTIVALCPYCQRGGVRAPETRIGSPATCPNCGSLFTVVPQEKDETPNAAIETRPHAAASAKTEESPVLPQSASPASKRESDPAFTGSLIALTLFGLGVVGTQFPFGRFIGLGLCGAGLLLALICLLAEGRARKFAGAAAGLNLVSVALLALVPGWLGFLPKFEEDNPAMPKGPHSIGLNSNEIVPGDRTDAGKAAYANGDVRIGVRASVQPVDLVGPNNATHRGRENVLKLHLTITNSGVERRIPLSGWAAGSAGEGVQLADPAGTALKVKVFEAGWRPAGFDKVDGLFPGKSVEVILLFDPPLSSKGKRVEFLNLDLPGNGVGQVEPIQFKLPGPF